MITSGTVLRLLFFSDHEAGRISDEEFIAKIRTLLNGEVSQNELIDAWNALLLQFPPDRIKLLKEMKSKYRIFLYSNTNAIHYSKFSESTGNLILANWRICSKKPTFHMFWGHRKPEITGFELIIAENGLDPKTTLFVDDALINVEGAIKAGLKGLYLPPGLFITDIRW